jgi:AAA domain
MNLGPSLHFLCSKAGRGKSTLSKVLAPQHGAALICEDIWLARFYPDELHVCDDYIRWARHIETVVAPMVVDLLPPQFVVLDLPANTVQSRAWFRSIFDQAGVAHALHNLHASNAGLPGPYCPAPCAPPRGLPRAHCVTGALW